MKKTFLLTFIFVFFASVFQAEAQEKTKVDAVALAGKPFGVGQIKVWLPKDFRFKYSDKVTFLLKEKTEERCIPQSNMKLITNSGNAAPMIWKSKGRNRKVLIR